MQSGSVSRRRIFQLFRYSTPLENGWHVQSAKCSGLRFKNINIVHCLPCRRGSRDDSCRFRNFRFLFFEGGQVTKYEARSPQQATMLASVQLEWNIPLRPTHIAKTKAVLAGALLPVLREQMAQMTSSRSIYRPAEPGIRLTCDTCSTSIFMCSWVCLTCGREACSACFAKLVSFVDCESAGYAQHLRTEPEFMKCSPSTRSGTTAYHDHSQFVPVTSVREHEIGEAIRAMDELVSRSPPRERAAATAVPGNVVRSSGGDRALQRRSTRPTLEMPTHEISALTDEVFFDVWAKGEPLLVTNVPLRWTPQHFMAQHGQSSCEVVECQTGQTSSSTVEAFFLGFGNHAKKGGKCLKLKDWPPEKDFQSDFGDLYEDFNQAVPVPNVVRRDGVLNLASHFHPQAVPPDLGPKMYNAYANPKGTSRGSHGSTKLHMDMADALNIMTHATDLPGGQSGAAAWDIFRAQDSNKIREFMRKKFPNLPTGQDPIHSQQVYLDDTHLAELQRHAGVTSYRVYQKAGEAVFIPAGCAHQQVCNLSDCIKIAIDFVSLENIDRCGKLTHEFREQKGEDGKVWKEDVLQLQMMMWFAWLSCCAWEARDQKP
ncbi:hypothetical protein K438DRAFT_1725852 [Mycena galopus ATCC 62051]|nr:hypothetical protein K438DRAFT_1725852 [Mycena galopus ATCC 62051]